MRKRPLFERVENYLGHNRSAARILIHHSDLNEPLFYVSCISPVTGQVLPLVILGTDIPAPMFIFSKADPYERHEYMTNSKKGWLDGDGKEGSQGY